MRVRNASLTSTMPGLRRVSFSATLFVVGATLVATLVAGCARTLPRGARAQEILLRVGPLAENSFYACLLNGMAQHLPLKQIQDECETKLTLDDKKGFGNASDVTPPFGGNRGEPINPAAVTGACNTGDPRVAGGPDGTGRMQHQNHYDKKTEDWGKYTWGGKGNCGADFCYKGLTEKESQKQKHDRVTEADDAVQAWENADAEAKEDPTNADKKAEADSLRKVAEEKVKKAMEDPNKEKKSGSDPTLVAGGDPPSTPPGTTRPVDGGTTCTEALQLARETVAECQRTAWRSFPCQELWAKMHHCPNPELIYVDPDAGYSCGQAIDPEAVKDAYVEKCRQLARPTPGGPDPCEPPSVDRLGRYIHTGPNRDPCTDPQAMTNPDDPECYGTLEIQSFAPDMNEIITFALNKIGGPIIVLPDRNPNPPRPGPGPK